VPLSLRIVIPSKPLTRITSLPSSPASSPKKLNSCNTAAPSDAAHPEKRAPDVRRISRSALPPAACRSSSPRVRPPPPDRPAYRNSASPSPNRTLSPHRTTEPRSTRSCTSPHLSSSNTFRERRLRTRLPRHMILLRRQLLPPFLVTLRHFFSHDFLLISIIIRLESTTPEKVTLDVAASLPR
jgi:hypothetical protein